MSYYWYLRDKDTNKVVHIGQSPRTTDEKPKIIYQYRYISDFIANGVNFELIGEQVVFAMECDDITPD